LKEQITARATIWHLLISGLCSLEFISQNQLTMEQCFSLTPTDQHQHQLKKQSARLVLHQDFRRVGITPILSRKLREISSFLTSLLMMQSDGCPVTIIALVCRRLSLDMGDMLGQAYFEI
jgi:hypothetical protein